MDSIPMLVKTSGAKMRAILRLMCKLSNVSTIASLNRSADEDDLAGGSGFKDLFVRARRLGEWQFLADDGA